MAEKEVMISSCTTCGNAIRVSVVPANESFYKEANKYKLKITTITYREYILSPPELFKCKC